MQAKTQDKPNQIKTNWNENEPKMNLLYMRFWSDNVVEFNVRSPMGDSDRQTDNWEC